MRISKAIPSMFHRRLLLLAGLLTPALLLPALQVTRLTVAKGAELREEAERRLVTERWTPTVRGRILDRKGRVLAVDRPSFDIAFDYAVITGQWATDRAYAAARKSHVARWNSLSRPEREALMLAERPRFQQHLDAMWDRLAEAASVSRMDVDAARAAIQKGVMDLAATVTEAERRKREQELAQGSGAFVEVSTADVDRPIFEETTSHAVLRGVPEEVGFALLRMAAEDQRRREQDRSAIPDMPGLRVLDSGRRDYPHETVDVTVDRATLPSPVRVDEPLSVRVEGVATHIVGWMRRGAQSDDALRRKIVRGDDPASRPPRDDRGRYEATESVGAGGFERAAEFSLRGGRGVQVRHLDTGEVSEEAPTPGRDVHLTIDAMLQARVQAVFDPALGLAVVQPWHQPPNKPLTPPQFKEIPLGTRLNGAAVVIDVASGEVLAMVTIPTFPRQVLEQLPDSIFGDLLNQPIVNRAIEKRYMPGSVVKPLMLCAAATSGVYGLDERIHCAPGHFFPDKPLLYRCWIYKQPPHSTHDDKFGHALEPTEALMASCNMFFFEMARRLGPSRVVEWYTRYGVGPRAEPLDLFGSVPASPTLAALDAARAKDGNAPLFGVAPWVTWPGTLPSSGMSVSDAVLMGIGQGPIDWTPLHAADAYATLARGGLRVFPRLNADAPARQTDLKLLPRAVTLALAGLKRSATEDGGTTHHIYVADAEGRQKKEKFWNAPGIDVWAKSGTADTAPFKADLTGFGAEEEFDGDHAWCVFLCGTGGTPKYACAVVVDHGGSGGRVSGPIANQLVHALIAEGYLPQLPPEAASAHR